MDNDTVTINPIRHYPPDCIGKHQRIWTEEIFNVPKRYCKIFQGCGRGSTKWIC